MPQRVARLPDHVANQIAAGEVVERPASVVKELVENALDAGAHRVAIDVEDGGKKRIRITDDGCGMTAEDAALALERHATSKVKTADDLKTIGTLGFRGEALPSIRSVSRFRLRTRPHDEIEGVLLTGDAASRPVIEPCGGPPGTEITVDDLFHNVPARRKFLRRTGTEMSRISALVDQLALGWPGVHFSLHHNGRKVANYPADSDLRDRILAVLGREVCRSLFPVDLVIGSHRVTGYVSEPGVSRPNPKRVFTFVNGRHVRDRVLQHAITRAYADHLDRGRHPITVLYVELPPEAVDVNVHPGKAEVRFVESGAVHGLVERAIRLMLVDMPWTSDKGPSTRSSLNEPEGELPLFDGAPAPTPEGEAGPPTPDAPPRPEFEPSPTPTGAVLGGPGGVVPGTAGRFGGWVALGRADSFLVCASVNALHFVHVGKARARVVRARLDAERAAGGVVTQPLLFPVQLDLTAAQAAVLEQHTEIIAASGIGLEPFGGTDWVLTELPAAAPGIRGQGLVEALVATLNRGADAETRQQAVLDTVARLAATDGDEPTAAALMTALGALPDERLEGLIATRSYAEVGRWFPK